MNKQAKLASVSRAVAIPGGPSSIGDRCDAAVRHTIVENPDADMPARLKLVKALLRADASSTVALKKREEESIAKWTRDHGMQLHKTMQSSMPFVAPLLKYCVPVPCGANVCLEYRHPTLMSASVCLALHRASRTSNMGRALESDWAGKHRAIMHECSKPIVEVAARASPRPPCHQVGFCICGEFGMQLAKLRKAFYVKLKLFSQPKSPAREAVVDRSIVAKLHGTRIVVESSPWDDAAVGAGLHDGVAERDVYWHIGYQSFSPYASTVRLLTVPTYAIGDGGSAITLEALIIIVSGSV
jgi:hypothetical protein